VCDTVAQQLRDKKPDLSNEQKQEVYGLFKQGSIGDNTVDKPGLMSGFEARGKWDAWESKKGMSQDDAKQAYVDFVTPLL
jgi:diazepam-binding inhibitor (GABA receptor modulating acyl-CoA-binding protein)